MSLSGGAGAPGRSDLRRWLPLLGVVGLLGLVIIAAALSSPRVTHIPLADRTRPVQTQPAQSAEPMPASPGPSDPALVDIPNWIAYVVLAVVGTTLVTVVLALLWLLIRDQFKLRRRDSLPKVVEEAAAFTERHQEQVVAAVESGLAELDAEADARAAVIACWVRLEELAANVGTPRSIGDTSTDLVLRLLAAHQISRPVLDRLAALYREARYATHVVDERMREEARASLNQLRTELLAPQKVPT